MDKRTPAVHGQDRDVLDSYLSTAMQPMSFAVGTLYFQRIFDSFSAVKLVRY